MTKDTFNEGLKLLKRFLKEENMYIPVFKKYIFEDNRPIEDLFNEFNHCEDGRWEDLFSWWNFLRGPNTRDYDRYRKLIDNYGIREKWRNYYSIKSTSHTK